MTLDLLPAFGANQHIGHVRTALEDRVRVEAVTTQGGLALTVAMVADGIGGSNYGERAAQLAVDMAFGEIERSKVTRPGQIPRLLRHALRHANSAIYREAQANKQVRGMGSTATVVAVHRAHLFLANVGDSRAYLVRQGQVVQLTCDHSWATEVVRSGRLTKERAFSHPRADELTRSLGYQPDVEVDVELFWDGVAQEGYYLPLLGDDYVVVCTDGLIKLRHDVDEAYVGLSEIWQSVSRYAPQQAAEALVQIALGRGVDDNVTVAVLAMSGGRAAVVMPRPGRWAIGVGVVGLFVIACLGLLLFSRDEADAVVVATATRPGEATFVPVNTELPPVVDEANIVVFSAGDDALIDAGMGFSPAGAGERLLAQAGVSIQSGMMRMELVLPDETHLFLGAGTEMSIVSIRDVAGSPTTHLILQAGQVLADVVVPAGQTFQIVSTEQSLVWVRDYEGLLGVGYDPAGSLSVDCFSDACHLVNIHNDSLILSANELGQISADGQLTIDGPARYERYIGLTTLLPTSTPTSTAVPLATTTATLFPVITWTPRPTVTPGGTD